MFKLNEFINYVKEKYPEDLDKILTTLTVPKVMELEKICKEEERKITKEVLKQVHEKFKVEYIPDIYDEIVKDYFKQVKGNKNEI